MKFKFLEDSIKAYVDKQSYPFLQKRIVISLEKVRTVFLVSAGQYFICIFINNISFERLTFNFHFK